MALSYQEIKSEAARIVTGLTPAGAHAGAIVGSEVDAACEQFGVLVASMVDMARRLPELRDTITQDLAGMLIDSRSTKLDEIIKSAQIAVRDLFASRHQRTEIGVHVP